MAAALAAVASKLSAAAVPATNLVARPPRTPEAFAHAPGVHAARTADDRELRADPSGSRTDRLGPRGGAARAVRVRAARYRVYGAPAGRRRRTPGLRLHRGYGRRGG